VRPPVEKPSLLATSVQEEAFEQVQESVTVLPRLMSVGVAFGVQETETGV
jgi:hypothetical protein